MYMQVLNEVPPVTPYCTYQSPDGLIPLTAMLLIGIHPNTTNLNLIPLYAIKHDPLT